MMFIDAELICMLFVILAISLVCIIYIRKKEAIEGKISVRSRKRRLLAVLSLTLPSAFLIFMLSLAYGPGGSMSLSETFSTLISAISKGGSGLTVNEIFVYYSRLPRALGALAVGIGLATAGVMFQAIIRNPLVDPYITGVSSGAGLAAVIGIVMGSSIGFMSGSVFMIPVMAMIGGLLAFGATMLIAEKSGGSSVNYVLGGVIVAFALSAVTTLVLTFAGDRLHGAVFWLFGSFTRIEWSNIWFLFIPALAISFLSLFWARELNLVLLGEDQAKQMGLNVRRFNVIVLITASLLTAVCVAFVGIIGFVGLVVPHMCRMVLGGDHRFVLPASIALGGMFLLLTDFISRMIYIPYQLPVGAITAIIGAPIFAYLLIKKGRMYDG
jgi:iron complex transport system permease protein